MRIPSSRTKISSRYLTPSRSISVEQFLDHPGKLLSDAHDGLIDVVTQDGKPVFMAIPMGASLDGPAVRLELAVSLFDREQVSLGVASRIAGLSIGETIDRLGRRRIPVARNAGDEFAQEMKYVRSLDDPRSP